MAGTNSEMIERAVWGGQGGAQPEGMWYGEVSVAVVTGSGDSTLTLLFQDGGAPQLDGNLYSLEQLTLVRTAGTNVVGHLRTVNMGLNPTLQATSQGVLDQIWAMPMDTDGTGNFTAVKGRDLEALRGVFLGAQINRATDTGLRAVIDENTNNFTVQLNAMGYYWSSSARSVVGGPKRPTSGLFKG